MGVSCSLQSPSLTKVLPEGTIHNLHTTHPFHLCGACDRFDVAVLHVVGLPLGLLGRVLGLESPLAGSPPCLHFFEILPSIHEFLRQWCTVMFLCSLLAGGFAYPCRD